MMHIYMDIDLFLTAHKNDIRPVFKMADLNRDVSIL